MKADFFYATAVKFFFDMVLHSRALLQKKNCYISCPHEGAINLSQTYKVHTNSPIIMKVRGKMPASLDEDELLMWF